MVDNGANSYYNGLVVQLRKRLSKGFEGSVAYTWSHAIDFNQGGGNNALFFNDLRSTFNGNFRGDKASSTLDQRHRFVFNSLLAPTLTRATHWAARYFVNGWQLAQITTLASAQPSTTVVRVVGNPFAGAAFNNTLNGLGGSTRVPFLGASNLDIDQIYRIDARLTRNLPVNERINVSLNFEVFNLFNRISNTGVNTEAYSAANGVLSPTARLGEGSASQGFPDGTNARRAQVSLRVVF